MTIAPLPLPQKHHRSTVSSPLRVLFTSYPAAYAEMQKPGADRKYQRVKVNDRNHPGDPKKRISLPLTDKVLHDHLDGTITVACALEDTNGMARVACGDIDHGGKDAVLAVHRTANERGYKAFAFVSKGANGHDGGYIHIVFDQAYEAIRLRLLMNELYAATQVEVEGEVTQVEGEARTGRADTRLPFGYHLHSETYGTMYAPDGTIYDLDDADQRREAIRLFVRTTNDQAPPKVEQTKPQERPLITTAPVDASGLKALRLRGYEIADQLRAARYHPLPPIVWAALKDELYKGVNPGIETSTAMLFNAAYPCQNILEQHSATLMRSDARCDYYGPIPGDTHSNPKSPKYKVDRQTNRCFGLSPNGKPGNDTKGHDPLSLKAAIAFDGNMARALEWAADLLAPVSYTAKPAPASTPEPQTPAGPTPEQRRAWADAKRQQREAQRTHAAAVRDASVARANEDARLFNAQGRGNSGLTTLLALLDFMGLKTWCRPTVETLAKHIGCSESYVQKGLAKLHEYGYIITDDKMSARTGQTYKGGCKKDTPIRTLVDFTSYSIATPQSTETGVYGESAETVEKTDPYTHVLVTESNYGEEESNRQAPAVSSPDEAPEPEATDDEWAAPGAFTLDYWAQRADQADQAERRLLELGLRGRTKDMLSTSEINAGLAQLHADYPAPQPEPTDWPDEAEQQPLAEVQTRTPKRRTRRQWQTNDPRQIERDIAILQRKAANVAKSNPGQARALRRQVEEKQRALVDLAERGDAEMDALSRSTTVEAIDDGRGLSVTFASPARESHTDTRAEPVYDAVGMIARLKARKEAAHAT